MWGSVAAPASQDDCHVKTRRARKRRRPLCRYRSGRPDRPRPPQGRRPASGRSTSTAACSASSSTQRTRPGAAFISAGGYHHHIGLNTWESRGGTPPPPGHHRPLPHRHPLSDRAPLGRRAAPADRRRHPARRAPATTACREALYLRDPDDNGVELYWDRPQGAVAANAGRQLADVHAAARPARPDGRAGPSGRLTASAGPERHGVGADGGEILASRQRHRHLQFGAQDAQRHARRRPRRLRPARRLKAVRSERPSRPAPAP